MSWEQARIKFSKEKEEKFSTSFCECSHNKYHHEAAENKCAYCPCEVYKQITD